MGTPSEQTTPAPALRRAARQEVVPTVHPSVAHENHRWIEGLTSEGLRYEHMFAELYSTLLKMSLAETARRGAVLRLTGPEVDDLAHQAAADSALVISRKISTFRGECRFTTWAFKFVQYDVSSKVSRHFWNRSPVQIDDIDALEIAAASWSDPEAEVEGRDLLAAVQRIIRDDLTDRQGRAVEAVALRGVSVSQVAADLKSNPNAIYKTIFDARRKLRRQLVEEGYIDDSATRTSLSGLELAKQSNADQLQLPVGSGPFDTTPEDTTLPPKTLSENGTRRPRSNLNIA